MVSISLVLVGAPQKEMEMIQKRDRLKDNEIFSLLGGRLHSLEFFSLEKGHFRGLSNYSRSSRVLKTSLRETEIEK